MVMMQDRRVNLGDRTGKITKAVEFLDYKGSEWVGIDGHSTVDGLLFCILVSEIKVSLYIVAFWVYL
jgi:hypothetical protein